jgi:hypothetical protein
MSANGMGCGSMANRKVPLANELTDYTWDDYTNRLSSKFGPLTLEIELPSYQTVVCKTLLTLQIYVLFSSEVQSYNIKACPFIDSVCQYCLNLLCA